MKSILYLLPLALLLNACGKTIGKNEKQLSNDAVPVRLTALKPGKVQPVVHAAGRFSTDDETYLSFKTGGIVASVLVREGDAVRKNQVLATLRMTEIDAQVDQARLALEKATRDHKRVENLYNDSVATLEQLENAKTGLDFATKQVEAAKFNKDYSEIRALANGYVLRKLATEGQVVGPGTPILQTNGAGKGEWVLKVGLSDRDWSRIEKLDRATVQTDAYPGKLFQAEVLRKSEGVDPFSGTFSADLRILDFGTDRPASGLFGKAEIFPARSSTSYVIPYGALLDADADSGYIFVTSDNKTARRVRVGIDGLDRDSVYVNVNLPENSALIVSGSAYLGDGSSIQIQK